MKVKIFIIMILFISSVYSQNDLSTMLKKYEGKTGIKEIESLTKKGVNESLKKDIDMGDSFIFYKGATSLMIASAYGYTDIVEYLIKNKANVNAKTKVSEDEIFEYVQTPLTYAIQGRNAKIVELLLKNKADVINESLGSTPLIRASVNGDDEIVKLLIKYGANVNIASGENFYPLMAAAVNRNTSTVEILIDAGADLDVEDFDGRDVLWYAENGGDFDTINLIKTFIMYK